MGRLVEGAVPQYREDHGDPAPGERPRGPPGGPRRLLPLPVGVLGELSLAVGLGARVALGGVLEKVVRGTGRMIDDMVFDGEGGFYLTDLGGTRADRSAGVLYVEPDLKTVHAVIEDGVVASNGIALAPDGRHLWVTEYGSSVLHYVGIGDDHYSVEPCDSFVPNHFSGLEGPDSCCIDADGNLYVAMCGQGRFLVFNPNGFPIGQILLPGREEGHMLKSTHPCLRPGTREVYLCSADLRTGESAIFVAEAYRSYQFQ